MTETATHHESGIIADQLERAFRGGAWHGPALSQALAGVTHAEAVRRPLAGAHSIWEIVLHLTAWTEVARRRLAGEEVAGLPEGEDWPEPGPASPEAWRAAVGELEAAHGRLHDAVRLLDDEVLEDPVGGSDPTVRGLLLGLLQHHAYHGGQVVLLRRALADGGRG